MNYIVFIIILILMICSLVNLFLIIKLKYNNDYYLTLDNYCSYGYEAELTKYRYNRLLNMNGNLEKIMFQGTTFTIIMLMSILIFSNFYNYQDFKFITIIMIIFLVAFIYLYTYIITIYDNNSLTTYHNYYKKYNAIVKYVYEKNNTTEFTDEYIYTKKIMNYEKSDNKTIDINLIKKENYDNNDFIKYFIIDNSNDYLNQLHDIIIKYTDKLQVFDENTINDASIFNNNMIDISNLKNQYKKILLDINLTYTDINGITYINSLVDNSDKINIDIINNIIINQNNEDNYNLTVKTIQYDKINDYNKVYSILKILYNIYDKNYDVIQEYLFYYKNIILDNIAIDISNYNHITSITTIDKDNLDKYLIKSYNDLSTKYYIKIIDIYKINETNTLNKLNDSNKIFFKELFTEITNYNNDLSDGIKLLYQNNDYNKLISKYYSSYYNYYYIYFVLFIILFTIILQFVSNFIQSILYLYMLIIIILLNILMLICYNYYVNITSIK